MGIQWMNRGDFFTAHEALEDAWRAEPGPIRRLYQGILQAAVACYHLERGNFAGARKLLTSAANYLRDFPGGCQDVDVDQLLRDLAGLETALTHLESGETAGLDRAIFPRVHFCAPPPSQAKTA
jgi:predicted metal-dependent hydrolase